MKKYLLFLLISCLALFFSSLSYDTSPPINKDITALAVPSDIFKTYTLPYDLDKNAEINALALFAWKEMIALNWKATYNSTTIYDRDVPDTTWSYKNVIPDGKKGEAVVWETYAHRTELRPANAGQKSKFDVISDANKDLNTKPNYKNSFGANGGKYTINIGKVMNAGGPLAKGADAQLHLLNCIDEDNEIGSCILFARTAKATSVANLDTTNIVLDQAKINKAGFQYKYEHFNTFAKVEKSKTSVLNNGQHDFKKLKGKTASCKSDSLGKAGHICFPCSTPAALGTKAERGIIEIKTAWRRYNSTLDNLKDYFHREAIYFSDVTSTSATANNDMFLLIGMHIIHKTVNYPTYVIASFEHMGVESQNYGYISKPGGDNDYSELYKINPALRQHDYRSDYAKTNVAVHDALTAQNPDHYLKNYRLIGVQGHYENGYPKDADENAFFLSNYVIESDYHLSNFYGSFGNPQIGKQNNFFNLVNRDQKPITAGGCKGCHGVAQTNGQDMSFLMDVAKPANMPDEGLLSKSTITSTYMQANNLLLAKQPNNNAPNLFLSANDSSGKPIGSVQEYTNNDIVLYYYDTENKNEFELTGTDDTPTKNLALVKNTGKATYQLQYLPKTTNTTIKYVYSNKKSHLSTTTKKSEALNFDVKTGNKGTITLTSNGKKIYTLDGNNQLFIGTTVPTKAQSITFTALGFDFDNYNTVNGFPGKKTNKFFLSYFDGFSEAGYIAKSDNYDHLAIFAYDDNFNKLYKLAGAKGQPSKNLVIETFKSDGNGGGSVSFNLLSPDGTTTYYLSANTKTNNIDVSTTKSTSSVFTFKNKSASSKSILGVIQLFYNGRPLMMQDGYKLVLGTGSAGSLFLVNSYKGKSYK